MVAERVQKRSSAAAEGWRLRRSWRIEEEEEAEEEEEEEEVREICGDSDGKRLGFDEP